ncbi:HHL128Wp [Eremothecium sinecaudum]|uniref:COX assembly mitochondrial protein n=1 Tax=Eremothecium sinecaudum TaxID=45286 RepID=A0A0X8HW66_9SACH|nr:HHL128Wp [Eremothecium sinecaudum]AMD22642.1 HHL128Wp [Eremothecium sinecaudum]
MHPQVEAERFKSCYNFIEALDKCHKAEFYKRAFGLCNNEKEALSNCLHEARMELERNAIKKNMEKRKRMEEKWKKMKEEEYGEDLILQKILKRHQGLNEGESVKSE